MGYILSPFIPPFAFGFLVAHAKYDGCDFQECGMLIIPKLALGFWYRKYVRTCRARLDRVLHGRDVSKVQVLPSEADSSLGTDCTIGS